MKTARQDYFSNESFERLINSHIETFFKRFDPLYENDESPLECIREEDGKLNTELSDLHNSNLELTKHFFGVSDIKRRNKNLTFVEAIEKYCKGATIDQKKLFEFSANIKALQKTRNQLNEKAMEIKGKNKNNPEEVASNDYTLARKVLSISFMMDDSLDRKSLPDKTEVARFIAALISDKPVSKKIENTSVYEKVKGLFFSPDKASISDLMYVKTKFEELGMQSIISKIDEIINKKEQ